MNCPQIAFGSANSQVTFGCFLADCSVASVVAVIVSGIYCLLLLVIIVLVCCGSDWNCRIGIIRVCFDVIIIVIIIFVIVIIIVVVVIWIGVIIELCTFKNLRNSYNFELYLTVRRLIRATAISRHRWSSAGPQWWHSGEHLTAVKLFFILSFILNTRTKISRVVILFYLNTPKNIFLSSWMYSFLIPFFSFSAVYCGHRLVLFRSRRKSLPRQ